MAGTPGSRNGIGQAVQGDGQREVFEPGEVLFGRARAGGWRIRTGAQEAIRPE